MELQNTVSFRFLDNMLDLFMKKCLEFILPNP